MDCDKFEMKSFLKFFVTFVTDILFQNIYIDHYIINIVIC